MNKTANVSLFSVRCVTLEEEQRPSVSTENHPSWWMLAMDRTKFPFFFFLMLLEGFPFRCNHHHQLRLEAPWKRSVTWVCTVRSCCCVEANSCLHSHISNHLSRREGKRRVGGGRMAFLKAVISDETKREKEEKPKLKTILQEVVVMWCFFTSHRVADQ